MATPLQVSRSGANLLLRMVLPCAMLQIWCVQKELREKASACTCHSADWVTLHRPIRLTQCCTQFKSPGIKILCVLICIIMRHSHLNDMEIPETKRFIPKGFELGTTLC